MGRTTAVLLLVLLVALLWWLMLRGWRRRAGRQSDLPEPWPADAAPSGDAVQGVYVSTTSRGDWLDRITAHGLGTRSQVVVGLGEEALLVLRDGAPSFRIPAQDVLGVRREQGIAGKVVEQDGLVVISWRLGRRELDTGVRPSRAADARRLEAMVEELLHG